MSSSASGTVSPALAGEHDDSDGNGIRPTGHVRAKKLRRKPEKAFSGRRDLSLAASEKRDQGLVSEQQATSGKRDKEEERRGQLTTPRRATSTSPASAAVSSDQCLCRPQLHRCLSDPKKEFRRGHAPGWEGGGSATRVGAEARILIGGAGRGRWSRKVVKKVEVCVKVVLTECHFYAPPLPAVNSHSVAPDELPSIKEEDLKSYA